MMFKFFIEFKNRLILINLFLILTVFNFYVYKAFFLFLSIKSSVQTSAVFKENTYYIFTKPTEIFETYLFLISAASLQLCFYYSLYHLYYFFNPAFSNFEFKILKFLFKWSFFASIFSANFTYFCGIKNVWFFFLNFQACDFFLEKKIFFEIRMSDYVHFCLNVYLIFFVCFQAVIFFFFFCVFKKVSVCFFKKNKKFHYFICFLFVTLLIPAEPFVQIFVWFFVVGIYEFCNMLFIFRLKFLVVKNLVKSGII